jgi:hypothetical protein
VITAVVATISSELACFDVLLIFAPSLLVDVRSCKSSVEEHVFAGTSIASLLCVNSVMRFTFSMIDCFDVTASLSRPTREGSVAPGSRLRREATTFDHDCARRSRTDGRFRGQCTMVVTAAAR